MTKFFSASRFMNGRNIASPTPVLGIARAFQPPSSPNRLSIDLIQGIDYDEPGRYDFTLVWGTDSITSDVFARYSLASMELAPDAAPLTDRHDDPPWSSPPVWNTWVLRIPTTTDIVQRDVLSVYLFQGGTRIHFQRPTSAAPFARFIGFELSVLTVEPDQCEPLGGAWVLPTAIPYPFADEQLELMRVDEVGLWTLNDQPDIPNTRIGGAKWSLPMPGNQFIEVCLTGMSDYPIPFTGNPSPSTNKRTTVWLECQGDDSLQNEVLEVSWNIEGANKSLSLFSYTRAPDGSFASNIAGATVQPWAGWAPNVTACVRFEAHQDGTHRIFFDLGEAGATTLFDLGVNPSPVLGDHVSFRMRWTSIGSEVEPKPRVLWARGGVTGGICITPAPTVEDWWLTGSSGGGFWGP